MIALFTAFTAGILVINGILAVAMTVHYRSHRDETPRRNTVGHALAHPSNLPPLEVITEHPGLG